jgi:hypothetical protein
MECENKNCNNDHNGSFGSGRFCCRQCATAFSTQNSKVRNTKISKALIGKRTGIKTYEWTDEQRLKAAARKKEISDDKVKNADWELVPKYRRRDRILLEQNNCCAICKCLPEWNFKKLVFQLDHISGNRKDESRENLRLVCPNCHSQTDTWGVKNVSVEGKIKMSVGQSNGGKATAKKRLLG